MALRYAILSLLADRPDTGYDLTKRFEGMLSSHAWHASHSQIYPELRRMTDDGLVEVIEEGARRSRTYTITDAGRAALREWLFSPPAGTPARNEHVLRLLAIPALDLADMRELVARVTEDIDALEAGLLSAREQFVRDTDPDARPGFAVGAMEFALRYVALEREWATWLLAEQERHAAGSAQVRSTVQVNDGA